MAKKEITRETFSDYLTAIFGEDKDEDGDEVKKVVETKIDVAANLIAEKEATGKDSTTLWDAFNAVTYRTSHQLRTRTTKRLASDGDRRFDAVLFGAGHKTRQNAFDAALAVLGN